jgi:hypothetical protein
MGDPGLFIGGLWPSRDHKILTIFMFFTGGIAARATLEFTSSPATLGIACGFRAVIAALWLFAPEKQPYPATNSEHHSDREKNNVQNTVRAV